MEHLVTLFRNADRPVAEAAGHALAAIGGRQAIEAINRFRDNAEATPQRQLAGDLSLKAAQKLLQRGQREQAA